jgi:protease-4
VDNPTPPDRRQDDWYKKALVEILEAHFREHRRARRWRFAFRLLSLIGFLAFISLGWVYQGFKNWQRSVPHVAVVRIEGQIAANAEANAERIVRGLREAFANPNAQSVLLQINSPGGSTAQAEAIYENLKALKAAYPKPVIAHIEDLGASAAYYIAVASDKILAYRSSLVGSIGVRIDSFNLTGLMERLGIERKLYTSGRYKGILDMFSKPEPEAEEKILSTLKIIHQQFIEAVVANRGEKLKRDDPLLFTGMFWSGEEALKLGLIDGILGPEIEPGRKKVDYTPPVYLDLLGKPVGALFELLREW